MEREFFNVWGTDGTLTCRQSTGEVVTRESSDGGTCYPRVARADVGEYSRWTGKALGELDDTDILFIGLVLTDGTFDPPIATARDEYLAEVAAGNLPNSPFAKQGGGTWHGK